ncbi:MAG: hypothetical protein AAFO94_01235 [Bacteroidota bacterium]
MHNRLYKGLLVLLGCLICFSQMSARERPGPSIGKGCPTDCGQLLPHLEGAHYTEYVRSVKKEYQMNADGLVSLKNEHGKVQVLTWDRDRVKVDVKITIYAASKSAADEVFSRVSINFDNSRENVAATTNVSKRDSWWDWMWNDVKDKYTIDYKVYVPRSADLELNNSHGDVFVSELSGSAELNVAHGDLTLDGVKEDLNLTFSYGTGVVHKSKDARVKVNFAKLRFKQAKDLQLTSSYSKIYIEQAADILSESTYDTYEVGEVREFVNSGRCDDIAISYADKVEVVSEITDVKVEKVGRRADLELLHGAANIRSVAKGFSELVLIGDFVDFTVAMEDGATYKLAASANNAGITYPKELVISSFKNSQKNNQEFEGYLGATKNPKGLIKVKVSNGGCVIDK